MSFPLPRVLGRTRRRGLKLILLLALLFSGPVFAAEVSKEYQVKAVFLWRLAQFVQWPTNAFEKSDSPLVIGVLGDNPFGTAVERVVRGETAQGRQLVVQYYRQVNEIKACHVLFIGEDEPRRVREIITALGKRSLLTVGDSAGFSVSQGGMVRFLTEQNKVKIRINLDAVTSAGLALDARLLRMAEVVRGQ